MSANRHPHDEDFCGWAWRGAHLTPQEIAAYIPGSKLMHLGEGRASMGKPCEFPVIFWVYVWEGFRVSGAMDDVAFPLNTCFRVVRVDPLPGGRCAIFLEQDDAANDQDDGLQGAYLTRHALSAEPAASASPELVQSWQAPFARWALDAEPGDLPLLGVTYAIEEAARFAARWANQGTHTATCVLETKQRFHRLAEIAAIAGYSDDDAFPDERRANRHLLPEAPGSILSREQAFVAEVTGLPEGAVCSVLQGEMIYRETLDPVHRNHGLDMSIDLDLSVRVGEGDSIDRTYDQPVPLVPRCRSFVLSLQVCASFEAEYSVQVSAEEGQCRLWVWNAPGLPAFAENYPTTSPVHLLAEAEATLLLGLIRRARISPSTSSHVDIDGPAFHLELTHGGITTHVNWWSELPEGWADLSPLVELLKRYALRYGMRPRLRRPVRSSCLSEHEPDCPGIFEGLC